MRPRSVERHGNQTIGAGQPPVEVRRFGRSPWIPRTLAASIGTLGALVALEFLLWTMPVFGWSHRVDVNEENAIVRYEPGRKFVWSTDWKFSITNYVSINNFGFVSDHDYEPHATSPLVAVVGDSYVEAFMVPFPETCAGRLSRSLDGTARVYPFAVGGSALSQYLAFAAYARDIFRPERLVVVIIENDYSGSLAKYGRPPGMHQFVEGQDGALSLERNDFHSSVLREVVRMSALGRHLAVNLHLGWFAEQVANWFKRDRPGPVETEEGRGIRMADSERAVDAFLDALPESSGLDPEEIAFVVDARRRALYEGENPARAESSYVHVMRRYFMAGRRHERVRGHRHAAGVPGALPDSSGAIRVAAGLPLELTGTQDVLRCSVPIEGAVAGVCELIRLPGCGGCGGCSRH